MVVKYHSRLALKIAALIGAASLTGWGALALSAPTQDDADGFWSDLFSGTDTAPGRSLFDGENLEFTGSEADGSIGLIAPELADEAGTLLQVDWSGGVAASPSTTTVFETGFDSVSDNILFENFPGRVVMAPLVGEQLGARPVERFAVSPIKRSESVSSYYAFDNQSTTAAVPSQSAVTNLFFYRDVSNGDLSFLTIHNEKDSTFSTDAALAMAIGPMPAGTSVALSDNPGALALDGDMANGDWSWQVCCSDGGALALPSDEFSFPVNLAVPTDTAGFDEWLAEYVYRVYSEADINAFPFTVLSKPAAPDAIAGTEIVFTGALTGDLTSVVFDFGALPSNGHVTYGAFTFDADVAVDGELAVQFRIGDTMAELEASDFSDPIAETSVDMVALLGEGKRFFQYKFIFTLPAPVSVGSAPEPIITLRRAEMPFVRSFDRILVAEGWGVSVLINPRPDPYTWSQVKYNVGSNPALDEVIIDVLDGDTFDVLLEDVSTGDSLASIDAQQHPSLRLKLTLRTQQTNPASSPELRFWRVEWAPDRDGDQVGDDVDNCPLLQNPRQADGDSDGIGDACDDDVDGDGVSNDQDNCPTAPNPDQHNTDLTDDGDACDEDRDNDGVLNVLDNCPLELNLEQDDQDGDGVGDLCDPDIDGDGLDNDTERRLDLPADDADSDDDGVLDGDEADYDVDTDGDGLINALDPDSDDDGIMDGTEAGVNTAGEDTDTDAGNFVPDEDPATTTDPTSADSDGGGYDDGVEDANQNGKLDVGETNPADPTDDGRPPRADTGVDPGTDVGANNNEGPDAGVPDADDGAPSSSGGAGDDGCGCAITSRRPITGAPWLAVAAALFMILTRIRRRGEP